MIGPKIYLILRELESTLWEFEANRQLLPEYPPEAFPASTKIFMSVFVEQMWHLMEEENIPQEYREDMVEKAGLELRQFIKKYTNQDSHDWYK